MWAVDRKAAKAEEALDLLITITDGCRTQSPELERHRIRRIPIDWPPNIDSKGRETLDYEFAEDL